MSRDHLVPLSKQAVAVLGAWAEEHGVGLDFIKPGKPTQNSYIERFNRTLREEVLDLYIFNSLSEVRTAIEEFISASQLKDIKIEFAKLKPVKVTLDGNAQHDRESWPWPEPLRTSGVTLDGKRSMTVKEAVFALAPILERMKKRGFDNQEIAEKLHEKGIDVKPPTLAKYLNEFRRGKDKKTDTPPPPGKTAPASQSDRTTTVNNEGFVITPDTALKNL